MNFQALSSAPKPIKVLCIVEALQRIAYVGGRALLLLMLAAPALSGGLNWGEARAIEFFGVFVALYLASPLIGGVIADRLIGHRNSVAGGLCIMLLGNVCLLATLGIINQDLNIFALASENQVAIGSFEAISLADFFLTSLLFSIGWISIIIGNGMYQTCAMSLIGSAYQGQDDRRESGFTLFYLGQSLGFLGGALIVGTLGETLGWLSGFCAAVAALLFATVIYMRNLSQFPSHLVQSEPSQSTNTLIKVPLPKRLIFLLILAVLALVFTVAYEQFMGFAQLFVERSVDRTLFGLTIPATWYPQLVSVFALIFGGAYISWMNRLDNQNKAPSIMTRFAVGLLFAACALLVLVFAVKSSEQDSAAKISSLVIVFAYFLLTIGELVLWPLGFATVEKLAPVRFKAVCLGIWLLVCASFGSYLAGLIGARVSTNGVGDLVVLVSVIGCIGVLTLLFKNIFSALIKK